MVACKIVRLQDSGEDFDQLGPASKPSHNLTMLQSYMHIFVHKLFSHFFSAYIIFKYIIFTYIFTYISAYIIFISINFTYSLHIFSIYIFYMVDDFPIAGPVKRLRAETLQGGTRQSVQVGHMEERSTYSSRSVLRLIATIKRRFASPGKLCIYIYIYIYICICVCVYKHILHTYIHAYIFINILYNWKYIYK